MMPALIRRPITTALTSAAVGAIVALAVAAGAGPAAAHGGGSQTAFEGQVGPYQVHVEAADLGTAVDYSVLLSQPGARQLLTGATVMVTARTPHRISGPHTVTSDGGAYEVRIPGQPGRWSVDLAIDGPLGRGAVTHAVNFDAGVAPAGRRSPWLAGVIIALPVIAAAVILVVINRREKGAADRAARRRDERARSEAKRATADNAKAERAKRQKTSRLEAVRKELRANRTR